MTTAWTRAHLDRIAADPPIAPVITRDQVRPVFTSHDAWDLAPLRLPDGQLADPGCGPVWMALSAPAVGDPGARHDRARLRLAAHPGAGWRDLGDVFPAGASLGSREWAGSAVLWPDDRVTVFYTAAGRQGETRPTFLQRIVSATASLGPDGSPFLDSWGPHREVVQPDGARYMPADEDDGAPGFIKAFRDPFFFRDPADGTDHLVFTGSLAGAETSFNGVIGAARRSGERWELLAPVITADGVNNELERPHVVVRDGTYYLFFSTQRRTFHPEISYPTGLWGFAGRSLLGPYEPLNGSGLVLANPPGEPYQAYSWLVLNDLTATSFVDSHSLAGRALADIEAEGPDAARRHFGGTMAPTLQLAVRGTRAWLVDGGPAGGDGVSHSATTSAHGSSTR
jgi:levansucrase